MFLGFVDEIMLITLRRFQFIFEWTIVSFYNFVRQRLLRELLKYSSYICCRLE